MAKRKGELVCCVFCGRDTASADSVCNRCRSGTADLNRSEEIGRHPLKPWSELAADPFNEPDEPRDPYHGDSVRDDL